MAKAEKTERLVVQMEPKLKADLEPYSQETGVPISEFVRRTLVEALKKTK
jgi:Ribbon-helix-helix domain